MREEQQEAPQVETQGAPWRAPRELELSRPRPARSRLGIWLVALFVVMLALPLALMAPPFMQEARQAWRLARDGIQVDGRIEQVQEVWQSRHGRTYIVRYRYALRAEGDMGGRGAGQAGQFQTGSTWLSPQAASDLRAGATVVVTYDPLDPAYSQVSGGQSRLWAAMLALALTTALPLLILGVYACWLLLTLRRRRRQRRLLANGAAAQAQVRAGEIYYKNRRALVDLRYCFRDQRGNLITGLAPALDLALARARERVATVLYDEDDAAEHSLYPLVHAYMPGAPAWAHMPGAGHAV